MKLLKNRHPSALAVLPALLLLGAAPYPGDDPGRIQLDLERLRQQREAIEETIEKELEDYLEKGDLDAEKKEDLKKLSEKQRHLEKRIAKLEARAKKAKFHQERDLKCSVASYEDAMAFPEKYIGETVCFRRIWMRGNLNRYRELEVFTTWVDDGKGTTAFSIPTKDNLTFAFPEEFARVVNLALDADRKYACNLYCEVEQKKGHFGAVPLALVYKVELLGSDGTVSRTLSW